MYLKNFLKKYWKVIAWAVIIIVLSLGNADNLNKIRRLKIPHLDKIAHLVMYAVLAFLLFAVYDKDNPERKILNLLLTLFISAVYGGILEWMQHLLTIYRNADMIDFLFNVGGTLFGIGVFLVFKKKPKNFATG